MTKRLFLDLETSGLPMERNVHYSVYDNFPHIVQLGYEYYVGKELKERRKELISCERIDAGATRVHGITAEMSQQEGRMEREVLEEIYEIIKETDIVIAHNIEFDMNILYANFVRNDFDTECIDNVSTYCTMLKGINICQLPGRFDDYKYPKLTELYKELFSKEVKEKHDALYDVKLMRRCYLEIIRRQL